MDTQAKIKLTTLSHKGGCGCKIGPQDLQNVLKALPKNKANPNLLVGLDTSDDAGVYRLTDDLAMVQTLDFFTPIVNDPYDFGQVAAANAISDVYAMGGTPVTALNIVAFPIADLPHDVLSDILRGAQDKMQEAGVSLVGGHSIEDKEPKFGLAVTGTIHPDKIRTNADAKVGDKLILTKPIGVGIMTSGLKNNLLTDREIKSVTKVMTTLNKTTAETLNDYHVHACTDVTGFGLLGHATEMAEASKVNLIIDAAKVPYLPKAYDLAKNGTMPGGSKNNHGHVKAQIKFPESLSMTEQLILCDAVTSGGLLFSIPEAEANEVTAALQTQNIDAKIIGEVVEAQTEHLIEVKNQLSKGF